MNRWWIAPLCLAGTVSMGIEGCPVGGDDDDSPTSSPCKPLDEVLLTAGSAGGQSWQWEIGKDGYVTLQTDCAHGRSDFPIWVHDNYFGFTATMVSDAGPGGAPEFIGEVSGNICNSTITFKYVAEGTFSEGVVNYGSPATLTPCL